MFGHHQTYSTLPLLAVAMLLSLLISGCAGLPQSSNAPLSTYLLEAPQVDAKSNPNAPSLAIRTPTAAPGYTTADMLYIDTPHQLDHFARHQWADAPARMIDNILVQQLDNSGLFSRVTPYSLRIHSDLRLETELIRLHQSFLQKPSQIELTLRAGLIDNRTNHPLGIHQFELTIPSPEETPYGGVIAANQAVEKLMNELINTLGFWLQDRKE